LTAYGSTLKMLVFIWIWLHASLICHLKCWCFLPLV